MQELGAGQPPCPQGEVSEQPVGSRVWARGGDPASPSKPPRLQPRRRREKRWKDAFIECPLHTQHCNRHRTCVSSLSPYRSPYEGALFIPTLQR